MNARRNGKFAGALALGLIVIATAVWAQVPRQPLENPAPSAPPEQNLGVIPRPLEGARPAPVASSTDSQLAAWLLVDNQNEIAFSRLAQQRSQDNEIKQFAQQMIDEHSKIISTLQRFADHRAASTAGRIAGTDQGQPLQRGQLDLVDLKQRLGKKCLETVRAELDKKSGREFDKCYATLQISKHMEMIDTLEVFKDFASPELRPVLDDGIKTAEGHLQHVRSMFEAMDRGPTEQARDTRERGPARQ